eukprot:2482411-Pleurochrysis_carterae.AAC.1
MSAAHGMLTATVSHPSTVPRASHRRRHGSRLALWRVPRWRWRTPCRGPRWVVLTSHTSLTVSTQSQIRKYHFQ